MRCIFSVVASRAGRSLCVTHLRPAIALYKQLAMSAILSADDLNDFISPGVACIKPIETLPAAKPEDNSVR